MEYFIVLSRALQQHDPQRVEIPQKCLNMGVEVFPHQLIR